MSLRKSLIPIGIVSCFLFIACDSPPKFYKEIDLQTYLKYKPVDTLYVTDSYIATKCEDTITYFKAYVELIKRRNKKGVQYFLLKPDAYLENDSTIIKYSAPFKSSTEDGPFAENGLWVYTTFFSDTTSNSAVYMETSLGANFAVDSTPENLVSLRIPTSEGIYFYQDDSLVMASAAQIEDSFFAYGKNGFYFIPNTGRFFKRYSISSID